MPRMRLKGVFRALTFGFSGLAKGKKSKELKYIETFTDKASTAKTVALLEETESNLKISLKLVTLYYSKSFIQGGRASSY